MQDWIVQDWIVQDCIVQDWIVQDWIVQDWIVQDWIVQDSIRCSCMRSGRVRPKTLSCRTALIIKPDPDWSGYHFCRRLVLGHRRTPSLFASSIGVQAV